MEYNLNEISDILELTQEAYSRGRYGEEAWKVAAQNLVNDGYESAEAIWILNSKYTRWAADSFAKIIQQPEDDDGEFTEEKLDGSELRQYKSKWGIDIEVADLPEIKKDLKRLEYEKSLNFFHNPVEQSKQTNTDLEKESKITKIKFK
jgi:hypothetical protein